jgi:hypothetical protein
MGGMHAQFVLFDGFDPLDVIAPFEVLAAGSDVIEGDSMAGHSRAGRLPRSAVTERRRHGAIS